MTFSLCLFLFSGKNEAKKREILSAASAAGVGVAFGAPVGTLTRLRTGYGGECDCPSLRLRSLFVESDRPTERQYNKTSHPRLKYSQVVCSFPSRRFPIIFL